MTGRTAANHGAAGAGGESSARDGATQDRTSVLEAELAGLRTALHNRSAIEQAIGVLMVLRTCPPQDAFNLLVRLSQAYNVKLYRIARLLVQLAGTRQAHTLEPALAEVLRGGQSPPAEEQEPAQEPDSDLVAAATEVVRTAGTGPADGSANGAIRDLYRLLVDRGWIPPHDVLGWL
jgi:hypothetical protein